MSEGGREGGRDLYMYIYMHIISIATYPSSNCVKAGLDIIQSSSKSTVLAPPADSVRLLARLLSAAAD